MKYETAKSNWDLFKNTITDQSKGVVMPPFEKNYPKDGKLYDLVPHKDIDIGNAPVYESIVNRRSHRKFNEISLSLEELSYLLLSTQGIINPDKPRFRTVPSGGARHGIETYLYIENVTGLNQGLYRYLPLEHKLLWLGKNSKTALTKSLAGQDFKPAATFIWTAMPYRIAWRYALAAEKLVLLDVGHICQNLYIACEAEGMGTCAIGAYFQENLDAFLGVDGKFEFAIYAAPVGKI